MSYILDALRKSEQERQLAEGRIPGALHSVPVTSRRSSAPRLLIAGVAALGLAAVGGAGYFLLRPQPPAPAAPKLPAQNAVVPITATPVPPAEISRPAPPAAVAARTNREAAVPKISAPTPEKPQAVPVARPEVAEARPDEIPAINISGYIRDGDAGGMVMINDKLVREGEEVAPGLRLEKILPDGAVFNYKGRRFTR